MERSEYFEAASWALGPRHCSSDLGLEMPLGEEVRGQPLEITHI